MGDKVDTTIMDKIRSSISLSVHYYITQHLIFYVDHTKLFITSEWEPVESFVTFLTLESRTQSYNYKFSLP